MIPKRRIPTIHRKLSVVWDNYLGAPYKLGGWFREDGYDCISLVISILWEMGYDVPCFFSLCKGNIYWRGERARRVGDIDIANYVKDGKYDLELIPEWFSTLGEFIDNGIKYRTAGDLLLCKLRNGQWMVSIYLGNEICTIVNGETMKVGTCPFKQLSPFVVEIRRCLL